MKASDSDIGLFAVYLLRLAAAVEISGAEIAAMRIITARTMGHFFLFYDTE